MAQFDPVEIEKYTPKLKTTKRVSRAVIRFNFRLANPQYVKAAQSGKTEAVVKVASYARGFRVKDLMKYIGRAEEGRGEEEKIHLENQDGIVFHGKKDIEKIYRQWSADFDWQKRNGRPPRHATHIIFSAGVENNRKNLDKVLSAARETAAVKFEEKGFDYLIGLHQDADHPHVHIVVKNKNREPRGKKFKLNKPELYDIRHFYAQKLSEQGLEHVATLRCDRPKVMKMVQDGEMNLKEREGRFIKALEKASTSPADFSYRKSLSRAIGNFRNQLKADKDLSKERLNEIKKSLRILEKTVYKKEGNIQKGIDTTIRKLGKDGLHFRDQVNELTNPTAKKPLREDPKALAEKVEYLEDRADRDVKITLEAIEKADLGEQKIVALDAVKLHEMTMKGKKAEYELEKKVQKAIADVVAFNKKLEQTEQGKPGKALERLRQRREAEKLVTKIDNRFQEVRKQLKAAPINKKLKSQIERTLRKNEKQFRGRRKGIERQR